MTTVTRIRTGAIAAATALMFSLALAGGARAELVVSKVSKAPALTANMKLPDNHTFDLPDTAEVTLVRTPAGQQFTLRGPYKGTLEDFVKACNGWLAFTHAYCKAREGGDKLPVGGTRGAQPPQ